MMFKDIVLTSGVVTPGGIVYEHDVAEEILRQSEFIINSGQALPGRLNPVGELDELTPELATHIVRKCWADRCEDGKIEKLWIGYEPVHGELGRVLRKLHESGRYYFSPRGIAKFKDSSTTVDPEGYQLVTFDCHISGLRDT